MFAAMRTFVTVGIVFVFLMASLGWYSAAYAQSASSPQAYASVLTGWQVEVSGPDFSLQGAALEEYPHGRGERVTINGVDALSYVEVAFFDDLDSPEETISVTMREFESTSQSFTILDSGTTGGVSYALAVFRLNADVGGYFYMQVEPDVTGNVDFAQSLFTLNLDFPKQLSLASEQITVNGQAFLHEPAIDVTSRISEHIQANPSATPTRSTYEFETVDSTVHVDPPVSLDFDSNANGFESVNVSTDHSFGIIGYLQQEAVAPADVLGGILASAPRGDEAPRLIHSSETREQVVAVYRIHRDGGVTIMVIGVTAVGPDLWRVEALAGPEDVISSDLDVFQRSVAIDAAPFLHITSGEALTDILNENQP